MLDMAPGTSTMLRARRRDTNVKPNRKLDRKSSRGMLYENEELRLRTININAEVEKGQNDIKKLRKENEHLRREIWGLRDEYDRLEGLLGKLKKSKRRGSQGDDEDEYDEDEEDEDGEYDNEDEEEEEDDDEQTENAAQENAENLQKATSNLRVGFDGLSVVDEETEENQTPNGSVEPPYRGTITLPDGRQGVYLSDAMPPRRKVNVPGPTPAEQKSLVEQWGYAVPRAGPDVFVTGGFPTGGNLDQLLQEMCPGQQEDVTSILDSGLVIRGQHHELRPVPREPLVLLLTGVPHHVTDAAVALLASSFGVLAGDVERRLYKGVDTGERILRLRPNLDCEHIPTHVILGGSKVSVKVLPQEDAGQNSSDSRYKSQINVRLRPAEPVPLSSESAPAVTPPPPPAFFAPIPIPVAEPMINPFNPDFPSTTPELNVSAPLNPFVFPAIDPIVKMPGTEPAHEVPSTPQISTVTGSPAPGRRQKPTKKMSKSRKNSGDNSDVPIGSSTPKSNNRKISLNVSDISRSSSSGPDSPRRRRVSVYFNRKGGSGRRDSGAVPNGAAELGGSDRENSVSSRTSSAPGGKRKLSAIEREKVPWCGCWGNGCI